MFRHGCSYELCQNIPTDKYVYYCMHQVRLLQHYKVVPVMVFDGGALPIKANTNQDRIKCARGRCC